jgi:16S rRNA (cytosine1402-N4)-methyltransferase
VSGFVHQSVLLAEAIEFLKPGVGKVIVDCTLGAGGHAEALLDRGATVIGFDRDPRAVAAARQRLSGHPNFLAREANFANIERELEKLGRLPVDGVLADLGVSSPQLDEGSRGFSFMRDGPLDMRMGQTGPTAAELIQSIDTDALAKILKEWGEEPFARPIARALKRALPQTTFQAKAAIEGAVPRGQWPKKIHVATRTFQALRIAVNEELSALQKLLSALPRVLAKGGIAAIISFHSLEDRAVKQSFREETGICKCPPNLPVCGCGAQGTFRLLSRKSVKASPSEQENNPRARSARLRAVEKVR